MRSAFAVFLRGFTLPFGATSGRRLVFDGVNGMIQVFDSANAERIRIGGSGSESRILFETGDVDQGEAGYISTTVAGAAGLKRYFLVVVSPSSDGSPSNAAQLSLRSENEGGTIKPGVTLEDGNGGPLAQVHMSADEAELQDAQSTATLPRGVVAYVEQDTATAAMGDATTVADMTLSNVPVRAGHKYAIHFHAQFAISAVASTWVAEAQVNGATVGRLWTWENETATTSTGMADGTVIWEAPTTQETDDFSILVDEATATAATCTLAGTATVLRTHTITDLGKLPT